MRRRFRSLIIGLTIGLSLTPMVAGEGAQRGVVFGAVVDASGAPLPGVAVALRGPHGLRQVQTDTEGRFRFPALQVGTYEVVADLLGLQGFEDNVRVFIDKATEVILPLVERRAESGSPAASETVQVQAVAPLIDRFETRLGTTVGLELLRDLPVRRLYQNVAQLLPGVAGRDPGNPNVEGALRGANLYLVDGVDTTDSTTGLFGLNLSYDAVEDVEVATGAIAADYGRVSGAVINVVTKSGDNQFRGSARLLLGSRDWNSDYSDPATSLAPELSAANTETDELDTTIAATLAGPLKMDRLWFFGALEDAGSSFLRPSLEGSMWDETPELRSHLLKASWRAAKKHSLTAQHTSDRASFAAFSPFDRNAGENRASRDPGGLSNSFIDRLPGDLFALEDRLQEGELTALHWNSVANQNLSIAAILATQDRLLERRPLNRRGLTSGAPHLVDLISDPPSGGTDPGPQLEAIYNGLTDQGLEERERRQASIAVDYFRRWGEADHELRAGADFQRTESRHDFNSGGQTGVDRLTQQAISGQLFLDADFRDPCLDEGRCQAFDPLTGAFQPWLLYNYWSRPVSVTSTETSALYVGDSVSVGRWLLSAGARYEAASSEDESGRTLADHGAIAPRLAIKYAPGQDGKALLSASYSQYFEPFLQQYVDDFVRSFSFSGFTEYEWGGVLGLDCAAENPSDPSSSCWLPVGAVPFDTVQLASPNLSLRRSRLDELTFGFERQLGESGALRLSYVDRRWNDLWDDVLELTPEGELTASVVNLPLAERRYRGLQLLFQKRFIERWQMVGSFTWGEAEGNLFRNDAFSTFADFQSSTDINTANRFGPAPYDQRYQLKLFASYHRPLGKAHLVLGTVARLEDGTPFQQEQVEEFGVRFLTPRGSERLEDFAQLDSNVALDLPLAGGADLELELEIFNLTNAAARRGVETRIDSGVFGDPRSVADLQRPRSFRLTLGLRF